MTYYYTSPTPGYAPTGDYILDWDLTGADGSAVLTSASGNQDVAVTVSTPTSSEGKDFQLVDGKLVSDDNATVPITTEITFDHEVTDVTFQLVDVDASWDFDDKVTILAYDADGNLVDVDFSDLDPSHTVDGNSVEGGAHLDAYCETDADNVTVSIAGPITKLVIVHEDGSNSSEAGVIKITDLGFNAIPAPELDGIVQGTAGDDLIDEDYNGDPHGDMVDNGDAILPGETGDDDIIVAGEGNDTVLAGAGDDEVYAGAGDDTVEGGAGDDELWGDSNGGYDTDGGAVREVLQWDEAPNYGDERDTSGFTQNTGSVDVTFSVLSDFCNAQVEFEDAANNVDGIDTGTLGAVDPNSGLALEGDGRYDDASVQLSFSEAVSNVQFRINDIDYDSSVKVLAFDADGNALEVDLTGGSDLNIYGDTAYASGGALDPTADANSMLVEIAGPVASIRVVHNITGDDTSHIQLSDVYFDVVGPVEGGDDVLIGGAGADDMFGEDGDDTFIVDTASDGDGDVVTGGNGPDDTADHDVLDLRGAGRVTIDQSDDASDDGAYTGTVTFSDGGTLQFSQIEEILTDPQNEGPDAVDDSAKTNLDTPVVIAVLDNDSDPDGDPLEVIAASSPDGTATINADGTITFQPASGFTGTAEISYTISDGYGGTDSAIVSVLVNDGIVEGSAGDDVIDVSYVGDPEGDMVDNLDEFLPGEGPNDDIIEAYEGDDTVYAGEGDDEVHAGAGDDTVFGEDGDDEIYGGDGSDTVSGGAGDDYIDTSAPSEASDYGWPPFVPEDTDKTNDIDYVDGGDGNDTILTGDDADTILGGAGEDTIDGGLDDDTIDGGADDDTIIGGHGSDTIDGGTGNDTIYGGLGPDPSLDPLNIVDAYDPRPDNGIDVIHGGDGDDVIYGQDDDDVLYGDAGNDTIDGGIDEDTIYGGTGDDTLLGGQGDDEIFGGEGDDTIDGGEGDDLIHGGEGADTLLGGDDRDTFDQVNVGDHINGNSGGDDWDTLDLTGSAPLGGSLKVNITGPDSDGNGFDGSVEYFDDTGASLGTLTFENIENIIPCFTPGTLIATPKGERRVEELRPGDRVITRDNGIQEIKWVGEKAIGYKELALDDHLKPVLIRAGALGNGLPERDMMVSPNHRVLVANDQTTLYFDEREVLAAAKHLVDNKGISVVEPLGVSYIHFMFEHHEVVLSDGAWTESFQPGDYSLKGIGNAQRQELFELFPELETADGIEDYAPARRILKKHEAKMLVHK